MSRPRIRTLKPDMWQDEKVGGLSRDARLLFIGLITMADDEGRLRGLPALILGHVFPYDLDAAKKITSWLDEIAVSGLIERYEFGSTPYIQLVGWSKHQKITRPSPSEIPQCALTEDSVNAHGALTEDSVPRARARAGRWDRKGKEGSPPLPPASGGRARARVRFEEEMLAWAASAYPDLPSEWVAGAVSRLRGQNVPEDQITDDAIRRKVFTINPALKETPA